MEEATETHWGFMSNGNIYIEKKEEIKKRIKRSPDWFTRSPIHSIAIIMQH